MIIDTYTIVFILACLSICVVATIIMTKCSNKTPTQQLIHALREYNKSPCYDPTMLHIWTTWIDDYQEMATHMSYIGQMIMANIS